MALYDFFYHTWKMSECNSVEGNPDEETYYHKNRDVILNRAKDYYENDQKRLREQARDKWNNLSEKQKSKKREYVRKRYHNMSKEKKRKLKNISAMDNNK